ncbi:MAG TPA: type II CAAX endopeptidase family protein [Rhizomicrobium sp.]|nr:type II CAAX endopeptidase family protein [Rhizomicrobium sp.]
MTRLTREIITFIVLAFVFSLVPEAIMAFSTAGIGAGSSVLILMWCPALAAFATSYLFKIDIATLGWSWRPLKYEWLGYIVPLLYVLPVYIVAWLLIKDSFAYDAFAKAKAALWGYSAWPNLATWLFSIPGLATIGMLESLTAALGEEIGWRGFLLPRLTTRFGFTLGCLVSGAIWALWHYPLIISGDYGAGTDKIYELVCFTAMIVASSFVFGWLRLKSQSLWPCAMLHASHNQFIQDIFDPMTAQKGHVLYVTTEFGIGLVITTVIAAIWFWRRRGELPAPVVA